MARRLFLHIGPPKTGTSYLQAAWSQHQEQLAEQGLLYPGKDSAEQFQASAVAVHKQRVVEQMPAHQLESWDRLTTQIQEWDGDALLSSEHYAMAGASRVAPVMARLHEVADEVHLVVGGRDFARQMTAGWQQRIKHGGTQTFQEFWDECVEQPQGAFWVSQNLPRLISRWGAGLPPERVHLVVLGKPGAPHDQLWNDMCTVMGVDPGILGTVERSNESLDAIQVELIRRMNTALSPEERLHVPARRLIRSLLVSKFLTGARGDARLGLSAEAEAWAVERSRVMVEELRQLQPDVLGDVRGDLDDLISVPRSKQGGRLPEAVSDAELAELAPEVLASFLRHELESRERAEELRRENRDLNRQIKRLLRQKRRAEAAAEAQAEALAVAISQRGLSHRVAGRLRRLRA